MQAGLFMGSQRSSGNVDYLRSLNITHILSVGVDTLHPTVPLTLTPRQFSCWRGVLRLIWRVRRVRVCVRVVR